jgi:hypothetical protein
MSADPASGPPGAPAGDEELLGTIARWLPDGGAVGRADIGGTWPGELGRGPRCHWAAGGGHCLATRVSTS